jgi:hypothetical protein
LKESYVFAGYDSFNKNEHFVLLRHDIDFSPHRALKMAELESETGAHSSYFIHIHSEYYNVLEKEIFQIIQSIASLGHDIGIHFDTHFYAIQSEAEVEFSLQQEKAFFKTYFDLDVKSFSFHNTNPFILSCQNEQYAGLVNTYSSYFQKQVTYCSDSNGYWRHKRMYDLIDKERPRNIQLLTHPEWWQDKPMSPWQKIKRAVYGRADKNLSDYVELLKSYGNKNIDW